MRFYKYIMAEEKEMKSIEYYVREQKRVNPEPYKTSIFPGFYDESVLKTKEKTNAPLNTPDDSLQNEEDATTEKGWIAPYDFYKNNSHTVNDSVDPNNGFIQATDTTTDNVFKYKDLYWWCEDLHNWCVYKSDCVNYQFLNSFYLHVWNGLDNWVPATYAFRVSYENKFAPLQNKIIDAKLNRGECIVMHRGALKNTPNKWFFSNGPLTINHAFILKKSERYSVNSENNFQTIRWSSPKHIINTSEYSLADDMMKVSMNGNTYYIDVSIRDAFAKTNSMYLMFTENADDKATPHHSPFYSNHQLNCCHRKSSGSCTFSYPVCENAGVGNGAVTYKKESQCNSYNDNFPRTIYWDNTQTITSYTNKLISDRTYFEDMYGSEKVKTPLNFRFCKYNHLLMSSLAMEKIFAIQIYTKDNNGNISLLPNIWINQDAPAGDRRSYGAITNNPPLYMSYVDMAEIFFKGTMTGGILWTMPANVHHSNSTEDYVRDIIWKPKNYLLLTTMLSMFQRAHLDSDVYSYFKLDASKIKKWYANTVDTIATTSNYFTVLYQPDPNKDVYVRQEFYKPNIIQEASNPYLSYTYEDNAWVYAIPGPNIGAAVGDLISWAINSDEKGKHINDQAFNSAVMTFTHENGKYELSSVHDYTTVVGSSSENNTNINAYRNMGKIVEQMLNDKSSDQRIENVDSMMHYPGYKDFGITVKTLFKPSTSNLREGTSISNPAVYRLPTGDIALCSQLHWGGEHRLIGGPGNANLPNPVQDSVDNADKFINKQCQLYFGNGNKKTINEHWLKEYNTEADYSSKDFGLVQNTALQSGFIFEQINNNNSEKFKLTLSTYRPVVITSVSGENVDVAKKW